MKDKPLEFLERKKNVNKEGKKKTVIEGQDFHKCVCTEDSFLVADCIAEAKTPRTITEELVLSVPKDILWATDTASCNHEWRGLWKNAKLAKKEP